MDHRFRTKENDPVILGLDIGGTKTAAVLGTLEGKVLNRLEIATLNQEPFETAFEQICRAVDELCRLGEGSGPQAISVAVGGPLDIEQGIIYCPPHLPTWTAAPLKQRLQERFGLPVFIEHDGNAGALAEFYFGAGQGLENLIYLTMGTGLGAGIILNRQIYRGTSCMAGEVGHIRLAETGPEEYGKAGSWEGLCSGAGIVKLARLRDPEYWPADTTTHSLVKAALAGDPQACKLIQEVGEYLGKGMAILADLLNPQLIVVGTLGVVLGDLVLEPAQRIFHQEALPAVAQACRIEPARLGSSLSSLSALIAAVDAHRNGRFQLHELPHQALVRETFEQGQEVRRQTIRCLLAEIAASAEQIVAVLKNGGKVLVCGNGGSAATAQHFSGELVGRFKRNRLPLPCVALAADSSIVTCIGNDYAYEEIFSRQVAALVKPGDLLIGFTTSGRSPNVLRALRAAHERGALTMALTGSAGLTEALADQVLAVPSAITARIQEEHDAIVHAWCEVIDQAFPD